jgi:hypothetical protein
VRWTLSSAVLRCSVRRARAAVAAGPLVAALVAVLVVSLPWFALVTGRQLAPFVAQSSTDPILAKVLAATIVAPALALGLAVGALLPGDRALGPQLAPAPVTPFARFTSLTLAPLAALVVPLTVPALVGAAAASNGTTAGRWLAAATVAAFLAAAAVGAALTAALTATASSGLRFASLPAAAAVTWLASGTAAGEPLLGVGGWLAAAATGGVAEVLTAAVASSFVMLVAVGIWGLANAAGARAGFSRRDVRVAVRLPDGVRTAFGIAVVLRLARHRQIRRHVAIAASFALGGTILLRAVGAGEAGASYLPFAAALVASAAIPPAAVALRRDADWLLRASPAAVAMLARAAATASVVAAAATIAVVLVAAAPVAVLDPGAWPLGETSAAMTIAAAVAGGALVPWRPDRVAEQTVSYVVVGALMAAGSYVLARGAAEAAAIGLPEAAFVGVAANVAVVGAILLAGAIER